jgi:hypothetical protein
MSDCYKRSIDVRQHALDSWHVSSRLAGALAVSDERRMLTFSAGFELGVSAIADIAHSLRKYGYTPSPEACSRHLDHLRTHPTGKPLECLQGTFPRWWRALGLPGQADRADDWLYVKQPRSARNKVFIEEARFDEVRHHQSQLMTGRSKRTASGRRRR